MEAESKEPWWKSNKEAIKEYINETLEHVESLGRAANTLRSDCTCPTLLNGHWDECPMKRD